MGEVSVALERRAGKLASLRISGTLRPGWCGNLAAGLSARGIGIANGHAVTTEPGRWRARFELHSCAPGEPASEEVATMLHTDAGAGFTTPIRLLGYRLEPSEARDGCLFLEVEGRDRVGFLAALLRRLAYFALFPVELRLETTAERVHDRLWLGGGGECTVSPRVEKALAASLDALVEREDRSGTTD